MQRSRLASLLVFAGVLLVLASMGLLSSVLDDWEQANGSFRLNKLTVNIDRSVASAADAGLSLRDAGQLVKAWSPLPVAYSAKAQTRAAAGAASAVADVFGVNGHYRDFAEVRLKAGTSIAPASVDEHSRVAVIGSRLADRLFRSGQVVGKPIELFGAAFTIIGVYDSEGSLLRQMTDDGIPDVLIPVTAMFDVHASARIDTLQLAARPDASVDSEGEAAQRVLEAIGQPPTQFRVANGVLAFTRIAQLRALLLFGCGAIAIVMLAQLTYRLLGRAYGLLRGRLLTDDWSDALLSEKRRLLTSVLAMAGMAACIAGLWELIRFRLYIPPEWVPEQVIDLSFYMDKLRSLWQQQAADGGYVPSSPERLADAAGRLAGRLFAAGALLGVPVFLLGIRLWAMVRVPLYLQLQQLFFCIPAAALAAFAAARWAGLYYRIEPLEYAVAGALFTVSIFYFTSTKGVTLSHEKNS
ncbi:MacB-like core domain-containing protein [Paenibacillus sp. UNCCL117]|uniref:ABC transporter permease n=1 Tax=unclassified Paenibacillus TaxID=185978 RepID=UPI0008888DBE|nr:MULTISPECIES: ABC transporter permease [unclassified Paenibacillus]SDD55853.1 MacB-like core domain-containing protein [Paenibacillus sp. cl123]SFW51504.1 MacB-like core domain-containing protein [Paenibacillus sp. UNCCL117]